MKKNIDFLYEVEIKSLLGSKEYAVQLRNSIITRGGVFTAKNKQLNHYFNLSDTKHFQNKLKPFIESSKRNFFEKIIARGDNFSVRTRDTDGKVQLVIKASVGNDTNANGVSRMEFESKVAMTIEELDTLLLKTGLNYQAKWSREREEYKFGDINICIDKNAGYGYLAEFEKMTNSEKSVNLIKNELHQLMAKFGVEELQQDRLERMFAYYNDNWRNYYETDKVFNVK